jgi:hypothetical protein
MLLRSDGMWHSPFLSISYTTRPSAVSRITGSCLSLGSHAYTPLLLLWRACFSLNSGHPRLTLAGPSHHKCVSPPSLPVSPERPPKPTPKCTVGLVHHPMARGIPLSLFIPNQTHHPSPADAAFLCICNSGLTKGYVLTYHDSLRQFHSSLYVLCCLCVSLVVCV